MGITKYQCRFARSCDAAALIVIDGRHFRGVESLIAFWDSGGASFGGGAVLGHVDDAHGPSPSG